MSRTKLLIIGDAGKPTGFEKVVRNVTSQLLATGKYDITIRGLGYDPTTAVRTYPVPVKPATATANDPVGISSIGDWVAEDQPDVILAIMDLWAITGYATFKPADIPLVAYFPTDTPNTIWQNALGLMGVAAAATYTQFGAEDTAIAVRDLVDIFQERFSDEVKATPTMHLALPKYGQELVGRMDRLARYQNPSGFMVIPHGFEPGVFEVRDKAEARRMFKLPADAFIVSNIGTNQFRKRLDLTLRAFAKLTQSLVPNAVLVLHCAGFRADQMDGYNLRQLARRYGIHDKLRLIHEEVGDLTDDQLCWLYNTADVNMNTSGGEGWGLCSMESAACGVPQLVPGWSGTAEIWADGAAALIAVQDYRIEPKVVLNTAHAVIDTDDALGWLYCFYSQPAQRATFATRALECASRQPTWATVGQQFDALIQRALLEPPADPGTVADLLTTRDPAELRSPIADWF